MQAADSDWVAALHEVFEQAVAREEGTLDVLMSGAQQALRRIAHRQRLGFEGTLSTTELVNEAWLRLNDSALPQPIDARGFFAIAARVMRQVLVDHIRIRRAQKRGGGRAAESLSAALDQASPDPAAEEVLLIDQALDALRLQNARAADVVQLRYFAGLSDVEIGELLGVEESTVRRDWLKARAWLHAHLESP